MRSLGYLEPALNEIDSALRTLAKYGSLGVGGSVLTHTNGTHTTPMSNLYVTPLEQSVTASSVFGPIGQVNSDLFISAASPTPRASIDRFETTAFDPFRHAVSAVRYASLSCIVSTFVTFCFLSFVAIFYDNSCVGWTTSSRPDFYKHKHI